MTWQTRLAAFLRHPSAWLVAICAVLSVWHLQSAPTLMKQLRAVTMYDYSLSMSFVGDDRDVDVTTFLPAADERQDIVRENILSGQLQFDDQTDPSGRRGMWSGDQGRDIRYHALITSKELVYNLDPELQVPQFLPEQYGQYLIEEEGIQVNHPEIRDLWSSIQPDDSRQLVPVLNAIYNYTYQDIEGAPFKGFTDALTALRLGRASCNGKGRLFVALARSNGIPARLVGGVIMNEGSKKTSHQWLEVLIEGRWVPFDPTNGYFARLPENYLRLYTGDHALFRHTRNINFDYRFTISPISQSPALFEFEENEPVLNRFNAARLMQLTGLPEEMIGVFLMFPLAALVTIFLRSVIGIQTFGIFMPMLIAAACVNTGLWLGLATFSGIVAFAVLMLAYFNSFNILKIPRLAAVITICTVLFIGTLLWLGGRSSLQFGILALFPVVIISFLAERIHNMLDESDWKGMVNTGIGTLITIIACYIVFSSVMLQGLFALMPELLLLVLAVQLAIGQWSGMRLQEYVRFRSILGNGPVLGMNSRNRNYVNQLNSTELLDLAADKLRSKDILREADVPVAKTYAVCRSFRELPEFVQTLSDLGAFALKPNRGSQGNGIMIIRGRDGKNFVTAGGKIRTAEDMSRHVGEILNGSFSQSGDEDYAYVEPLLSQHSELSALSDFGLSDIRVILHKQRPVSAMLRLPTEKSGGKANLHQGAIGLAIDIESGKVTNAALKGTTTPEHPDTGAELIGFKIPKWRQIVDISIASADAIPLGYIGVDICLDQDRGPLVLEVNGRPGIEIQNVQQKGLVESLTDKGLAHA
ncbi:MAG: sugar-transfer associated ATP-grasp domain-containing protein [Pseudomonadota bacterium]